MNSILLATALIALGSAALARVPTLNATCGDGTEVHADEGGPVYINGKEAKLHKSNDNYYEAKLGHVTISISISPDGSADVSYTGKGGANGICQVASQSGSGGGGCPADVSEADRYKYPACN